MALNVGIWTFFYMHSVIFFCKILMKWAACALIVQWFKTNVLFRQKRWFKRFNPFIYDYCCCFPIERLHFPDSVAW